MDDDEKLKIQGDKIETLIFSLKAISEKYVYYLLAINAACVGFSINLSKDLPLSYYVMPLGIAMLLWGISFSYGLIQISSVERHTELNIKELKAPLYKVQLSVEEHSELYTLQDKIKKYRLKQNQFFCIRSCFFCNMAFFKNV